MNMDRKRKEELETILMIAGMALMGAIGIIALFCGLFGVDIFDVGAKTIAGMLLGMTGFLFGIILLITTSSQRK